jgi:alpha-beta hydrolase superfamily lysophospholipase
MVSERTEILKSFDGEDIFFRCCTPRADNQGSEKIAGLVIAVHGFGEHSGRYAHVAEFVCKRGMAFVSFDLRGHGQSGPARGDVQNLQALVLDVIYVVNHSLRILGFGSRGKDFFYGILGHSFGGLLVTYAASILGDSAPPVFLSSPCYGLRSKLPLWKRLAADVLPKFVPELKVPLDINPEVISKNPENNARYASDSVNLKEVTARYGRVFIEAMIPARIRHSANQVIAPVTLVFGGSDDLVSTDRTVEVASQFAPGRCEVRCIEGAGHEIFNETEVFQSAAFEYLGSWLDAGGRIS